MTFWICCSCSLLQGSPQWANLHNRFGNGFTWDTLLDATWDQTCSLRIMRSTTEILQLHFSWIWGKKGEKNQYARLLTRSTVIVLTFFLNPFVRFKTANKLGGRRKLTNILNYRSLKLFLALNIYPSHFVVMVTTEYPKINVFC